MFVAVGTMLSGCVSTGPTQSAVSAEEAEKIAEVITKLDQQWGQAFVTKDTAFLKSIWADDLRFTQHDGKVNDKEAALADAEGNTDTVTSGVISDYKVRVYGKNFAVVAGDYHVALDNRLANLIFYLLEAQSDDGLAYWNFFDSYLQSQLAQNPGDAAAMDFPVFKVLPFVASQN